MTLEFASYMLLGMPVVVVVLGWHSYRLAKRYSPTDAWTIMVMALVMAGCQFFTGIRLLWVA